MRCQLEFEEDFKSGKLTLREYIRRMMQWRDKYENILDSRPRFQSLDTVSKWLIEFQHGKFDEVEVPGQYLEVRVLRHEALLLC
jgi:transformation/transcription domain-associated protein